MQENELLKVSYNTERPTVSARDLHDFLEVGTPFDKWFPRMCEYGFRDGEDFSTFLSESTGGRPAQDAQLTIEMAKELCMIQRNERGKQARQYFIQVENDWNSPDKIMARALKVADSTIRRLEVRVEEMRPKEIFADAVATSKRSILIGELAKLLKQNGFEIGQNKLFELLRNDGYLIKGKHRSDRNMPTQRAMEMGLFEIKETTIVHSDGHTSVNLTTKVTGKGQIYFVNKYTGRS